MIPSVTPLKKKKIHLKSFLKIKKKIGISILSDFNLKNMQKYKIHLHIAMCSHFCLPFGDL